MRDNLKNRIFSIKDDVTFGKLALDIFRYQSSSNIVYRNFTELLGIDRESVVSFSDIPFLPVEFFKDHKVITGEKEPVIVFESSRTTGSVPAKHYIIDPGLYLGSLLSSFGMFYGDPASFIIAALLPSYSERGNSSLVYMVNRLIEKSGHELSGFYNNDAEALITNINKAKRTGEKVILIGVSFALLDIAERYSPDFSGVTIMETGGMKGSRKEITRQELHSFLNAGFHTDTIHSEYGMTELLSQAYSGGDGIFYSPPWMKILIRDPQDPLSLIPGTGTTGGINVIDLANLDSCSFLATGDLGKVHPDGSFEVAGRFDASDIRGCNLMVE